MTSQTRYTVTAPQTPGAMPTSRSAKTLAEARKMAREYRGRADLRAQDVRIEREGRLVEYGPIAR